MDEPRPTIISARPARQQIERSEVLKYAHRILGAQNGDRAGQTNPLRPCRSGSEDDRRGGIEELAAVVFTNTKRVQANLVGVFNLVDQLSQTIRRIQRAAVLIERGSETINTHLHRLYFRKRSLHCPTASSRPTAQ
jgi:hypothetical protein